MSLLKQFTLLRVSINDRDDLNWINLNNCSHAKTFCIFIGLLESTFYLQYKLSMAI